MLTKSAAALIGTVYLLFVADFQESCANPGVFTSANTTQNVPDTVLPIIVFSRLLDLECWASGPEV